MFVLDPSLTAIEAGESDVVAVHRSTEAVAVAVGETAARPCQAYVCAIREGETTMVYLALEHPERKKIHIYRPEPPPAEGASERALLREALDFAASLGFTMQEINLSYSKAMREVVIRDIHVIRRPTGGRVVQERPAAPQPAAAGAPPAVEPAEPPPAEPVREAPPPPAAVRRKEQPAATEAASLEGEAERLAAEKARLEQETAAGKAALQAKLERLVAENETLRSSRAAEEAALTAQLQELSAEKQRLESAGAEQLAALKKELAQLRKELRGGEAAVDPEVAALKAELAALAAEKEHAGEQAMRQQHDVRAELKRLADEKKHAERQAEERLAALRAERDDLAAAQSAAETAAAAELGKLDDAIARLTAETTLVEDRTAARRRELEAEVERLAGAKAAAELRAETDLAGLREAVARLTAELAESRQQAIRELTRLAVEAELLAAEREAVERFIAGRSSGGAAELLARAEAEAATLKGEVTRLAAEKSLADQTAATRIAALQAELERYAGNRAAQWPSLPLDEAAPSPAPPSLRSVATPTAAVPADARKGAVAAGWDDEVVAAVDALGGDGPLDFPAAEEEFGGFGEPGSLGDFGAPVSFRLDKNLSCIEYDQPDDVIALQHALNMVNISPEGHLPQTCGAYICALRQGESYRVYVAWQLTVDKKTLVYAPDRQPESEEACRKIVNDAVAFVETVGFMMDTIRLSGDADKRLKALAKVPVLCRKE